MLHSSVASGRPSVVCRSAQRNARERVGCSGREKRVCMQAGHGRTFLHARDDDIRDVDETLKLLLSVVRLLMVIEERLGRQKKPALLRTVG